MATRKVRVLKDNDKVTTSQITRVDQNGDKVVFVRTKQKFNADCPSHKFVKRSTKIGRNINDIGGTGNALGLNYYM